MDVQALLAGGQQLSSAQLHGLVDAAESLLADPNNKTAQGTLEVLSTLVKDSPETMRPYVGP